jgi:hypothetical protein
MDHIALQTLRGEMLDDCRVAREAFEKAASRFERQEEVAQHRRGASGLDSPGLKAPFA